MPLNFSRDETQLTGAERLRLANARKAQFDHEIRQNAHDRFMQNRRNFVEANPNAVSPQERNAILGYVTDAQRDQARFAHEQAMLDRRAGADVAVAENRRDGMIGQGRDAATASAGATVTAAEKQWSAQRDIAQSDADARRYIADRGLLTEQERQKGALAVTRQQGDNSADVEEIRQQGANKVAETQGKAAVSVAQAEAEARLQRERAAQESKAYLEQLRQSGRYSQQQLAAVAKLGTVPGITKEQIAELIAQFAPQQQQ